ncbi:hypothetical protein MA16_Dca014418 [Dendrobium catenatum]|uniref:Uncharacterized protein n=1 Tax=Dendrobium catenatum TaxID=906689 RepID=A0A2I0VTR8_9ASPA|nr:hypothetical protein MA16_Dca014418 [Dendrobium catenatum]
MTEQEAELERREAALAATPILQPDFRSSKVTQAQLDKFKVLVNETAKPSIVLIQKRGFVILSFTNEELNKRRLQLKEKSKDIGKPKGKASQVVKACSGLIEDGCKSKLANNTIEASNLSAAKGKVILDDVVATVPKKKKKLHWGLEAKERWERKSNM